MRNFAFSFKRCLVAAGLLAALVAVGSATAQVRSSLPCRTLDPVQPPLSGQVGDSAPCKIEVIQFSYYGCPHCFDAQPLIEAKCRLDQFVNLARREKK